MRAFPFTDCEFAEELIRLFSSPHDEIAPSEKIADCINHMAHIVPTAH